MKFAVIDIGSNTLKLNIYDATGRKFTETGAHIVRAALASYRLTGALSDEGVSVLIKVMRELVGVCRSQRIKHIFPYATQSLRGISNADEVLLRVKTETGLDINVISGKEEARLGFRSFISAFGPDRRGMLSDMGGGSTELTVFDGVTVLRSASLPFGSLSLAKECGAGPVPDEAAVGRINGKIEETVRSLGFYADCDTLYATGGTISGAFRLCGKGDGEDTVSVNDLKDLLYAAQKDPVSYEKTAKDLMPERYDSVFSGIAAYIAVCGIAGVGTVVRSGTTCRYGYASEIFEKMFRKS